MYGTHDHPRWSGDTEGRGGPAADGPAPGRGAGRRGHGPRGHGRRGPFGPGGFGPGGRGRHGGGMPGVGPFGGPPGRGGRGGKGRRSRGDVRLAVLALLAEQAMHGYQIIQEIGERSGGSWQPSPGSVYPTVSQLADEGMVRTEKSEGRSVVHLTDQGREWTEAHTQELDAVWRTAGAEDGFASLREAGAGLMGALQQVAAVGTEEQVAEAVRVVEDSRRRVYLLLAGEVPETREALREDPSDER